MNTQKVLQETVDIFINGRKKDTKYRPLLFNNDSRIPLLALGNGHFNTTMKGKKLSHYRKVINAFKNAEKLYQMGYTIFRKYQHQQHQGP
ncbi:unnamed protein product [Cunninghamella blakesleeana]